MIDSLKCVEDRYSWQLEDSIWSAPSQDDNWHNTNLLRSDLRWLARWVDTTTCRLPCTSFAYERANGDTWKGLSRKAQLLPRDWHLYLWRNDPCLCGQTCSTFFKTNHVSLSSTHTHTHTNIYDHVKKSILQPTSRTNSAFWQTATRALLKCV